MHLPPIRSLFAATCLLSFVAALSAQARARIAARISARMSRIAAECAAAMLSLQEIAARAIDKQAAQSKLKDSAFRLPRRHFSIIAIN